MKPKTPNTRNRTPSKAKATTRETILEMAMAGNTDGEIADATGAGPALIQRVRCTHGLYRLTPRAELIGAMFLLLETDMTYLAIAGEYRRTVGWVRDLVATMKQEGFVVAKRKVGRPRTKNL